jgi:hypothetical protein
MSTMSQPVYVPTSREIHDAFLDEITSLGGVVPDVYDDGQSLFARAVLAADAEIRPGDTVRAGVAVRVLASEIVVHPYTFRTICSNGAIVAHAMESRSLERSQSTEVFLPTYDIAVTLTGFRTAVRACAAPEAFDAAADEMRTAAQVQADMTLQLLPTLARLPQQMAAHVMRAIFQRYAADGDQSAFGLMNAVTSVARDTDDVEARWNLEELGGGIPARLGRQPRAVAPTLATAGS